MTEDELWQRFKDDLRLDEGPILEKLERLEQLAGPGVEGYSKARAETLMEYGKQINIHRFKLLMLRKEHGIVRPDPQDPKYKREREDLEAQITAILQARGKTPTEINKIRKESDERIRSYAETVKLWLERGYVYHVDLTNKL